jgi:hypothetical protein
MINITQTNSIFLFATILFCFFTGSIVFAGPNESAGCALDLDFKTSTIESSLKAETNEQVMIAVVAKNVSNLDTFQVEIKFNPKRMAFVDAFETYGFEYDNFLSLNYGNPIGLQVKQTNDSTINIANALSGQNTNEAPDGSGVIAYVTFKILDNQANNHLTLANVHYIDSLTTKDSIQSLSHATVNKQIKGDLDNNEKLDLRDVIAILKVLSEMSSSDSNNNN